MASVPCFCTWSFESLCQASLLILCGFCATVIGLSSDVSIFVVRSLVVVLQLGLFVVSDVIFSFKFFCSAMLASRAFLHVVWCSELLSAVLLCSSVALAAVCHCICVCECFDLSCSCAICYV